jgi:succinyl-CoA synthetase beta subunit
MLLKGQVLNAECRCDQVDRCLQVNPLAETPEGTLLAADAKLGFDDNASYRQKEIFAMKDDSQIDSR